MPIDTSDQRFLITDSPVGMSQQESLRALDEIDALRSRVTELEHHERLFNELQAAVKSLATAFETRATAAAELVDGAGNEAAKNEWNGAMMAWDRAAKRVAALVAGEE